MKQSFPTIFTRSWPLLYHADQLAFSFFTPDCPVIVTMFVYRNDGWKISLLCVPSWLYLFACFPHFDFSCHSLIRLSLAVISLPDAFCQRGMISANGVGRRVTDDHRRPDSGWRPIVSLVRQGSLEPDISLGSRRWNQKENRWNIGIYQVDMDMTLIEWLCFSVSAGCVSRQLLPNTSYITT